jgi:hypothetical protein
MAGISRSFITLAADSYTIVKSMQRGTIVIDNGDNDDPATISAVTPSKASLRWHGAKYDGTGALPGEMTKIVLTNSTTITASRNSNPITSVEARYEIDEKP